MGIRVPTPRPSAPWKQIKSQWRQAFALKPFLRAGDAPEPSLTDLGPDPLLTEDPGIRKELIDEKPLGQNWRLSKRQLRKQGLWGGMVPLDGITWDALEGMRELSRGYLDVVLQSHLPLRQNQEKLVHADLHGAVLTVSKSDHAQVVGKTGTVVLETSNVLRMVTREDKVINVPKKGSVLTLPHGKFKYIILGLNLCVKPALRSKMKIHTRHTLRLKDVNSRYREVAALKGNR